MITLSDTAQAIVLQSHTRHIRVDSWLNGALVAADVPIDDGTETVDLTARVPEYLTLTVPRICGDNINWSPLSDSHPLGSNCRLRLQIGIEVGYGEIEWVTRGWYVITRSATAGDVVNVEAAGLLWYVNEAAFINPFQPTGTFVSTVRGLIEPALSARFVGLTDRAVPSGLNYDQDRMAALLEVLDSWPAELVMASGGYAEIRPPSTSTTPVLDLRDNDGGTVVQADGSSSREGGFTAVVARGTASDGSPVQGVSYVTSGPRAAGGPFNPLGVPYEYFSPLLTTVAQCLAAASTVRARLQKAAGQSYTVELVPHPGLQAGDVVRLYTADVNGALCTVDALSLPLKEGAQTLTVRRI